MATFNSGTLLIDNRRVTFDSESLVINKGKKTVSTYSQNGTSTVKNTYFNANTMDTISFDIPASVEGVDVYRTIEANDLNDGTNVGIITPEYSFTLLNATLMENVDIEVKPEGKVKIKLEGVKIDTNKIPG
jgi:hypothetical protein